MGEEFFIDKFQMKHAFLRCFSCFSVNRTIDFIQQKSISINQNLTKLFAHVLIPTNWFTRRPVHDQIFVDGIPYL